MQIEATFLRDTTHGGAQDQARVVAAKLADFIAGAQSSIHAAIYDFRLGSPLGDSVVAALKDRASSGVEVFIAFDQGKPATDGVGLKTFALLGSDPAPTGTGDFLKSCFEGTAVQVRGISGSKLMHSKYIVRDGNTADAAVWTGSTNLTDDAWTYQENNIVVLPSSELALYFEHDFRDLWMSRTIAGSGAGDSASINVGTSPVYVAFSPADGVQIDQRIAGAISAATKRIRVASMIISSHGIIGALDDVLSSGRVVDVRGVYDKTQMEMVLASWSQIGRNDLVQSFETIAGAFASKVSTPYSPTSRHDFMHDKILVADNMIVTGSFNFSRSATENAENIVKIDDPVLADRYCQYIDALIETYSALAGAV